MNRSRAIAVAGIACIAFALCNGISAQDVGYRSAIHPFPPASTGSESTSLLYMSGFTNGNAILASSGSVNWYSSGVNQINASLFLPGETWLATNAGLKCLDLKGQSVRHYTTLDGLPYQRIVGVAHAGSKLLCAAMSEGETPRFALCIYDSGTHRWSVRSDHPAEDLYPPKALLQVYGRPQKYLFDASGEIAAISPVTAGSVSRSVLVFRLSDATAHIEHVPISEKTDSISALKVNANSVWVGATSGLYRLDAKANLWSQILERDGVARLAKAENGSLWALTSPIMPPPNPMDITTPRISVYNVMHFVGDRAVQTILAQSMDIRKGVPSNWPPEDMVYTDGKIWITHPTFSMHAQWPNLPPVTCIDPASGSIKQIEAPATESRASAEYQRIPPIVLANSNTGGGGLAPLIMPKMFPGWVCPSDEHEQAAQASIRVKNNYAWQSGWQYGYVSSPERQGQFLIHTVGKQAEYYSVPNEMFTVHDNAACPITFGDRTYFLLEQSDPRLMVWNRSRRVVEPIPAVIAELKTVKAPFKQNSSMLGDGVSLWICCGEKVIHYNTVTHSLQTVSHPNSGYAPQHGLLGVDGNTALVRTAPDKLYRVDPQHSADFEPVVIPRFPGDVEKIRSTMIPVSMGGGIVWFSSNAPFPADHKPLIGLNMKTQLWTKPTEAQLPYSLPGGVIRAYVNNGVCWLPSQSRHSSAIGYDLKKRTWQILPPLPAGEAMQYVYFANLVCVDGDHAWIQGLNHLYRLTTSTGKWNEISSPYLTGIFPERSADVFDHTVSFGTPSGVWRYNLGSGKTEQSPGIAATTTEMQAQIRAGDAESVWLTLTKGSTICYARFDTLKHTWNLWKPEEGAPQSYGDVIATPGSCWVVAGGHAYHLNRSMTRWDAVSEGAGKPELAVRQIVPDGDDVWIVPGFPMNSRLAVPQSPGAAPLYRYAKRTDTLEPVFPADRTPLTAQSITVTRDGAMLAANEGVFRLERGAAQWAAVAIPGRPHGFAPISPTFAHIEGKHVWVGGDGMAASYSR